MARKTISVLGCGWLGYPLAKRLITQGYRVKGSTSTRDKLTDLQNAGIIPYLINFLPQADAKDVKDFFDCEILFLNIPYRRNLPDPRYYLKQIQNVTACLSTARALVVFASSTSIYPDNAGRIMEGVPFRPQTERAQVLWEVEQFLLQQKRFDTTIIRFAGLYGGERKIGRFLAGKKDLAGGLRPVNLIHLADCISLIERIIEKDIRGEIFNACADGHPTKKQLYTQAALKLGIKPPHFKEEEIQGPAKIVDNTKLKKKLDFTFRYPDPLIE